MAGSWARLHTARSSQYIRRARARRRPRALRSSLTTFACCLSGAARAKQVRRHEARLARGLRGFKCEGTWCGGGDGDGGLRVVARLSTTTVASTGGPRACENVAPRHATHVVEARHGRSGRAPRAKRGFRSTPRSTPRSIGAVLQWRSTPTSTPTSTQLVPAASRYSRYNSVVAPPDAGAERGRAVTSASTIRRPRSGAARAKRGRAVMGARVARLTH